MKKRMRRLRACSVLAAMAMLAASGSGIRAAAFPDSELTLLEHDSYLTGGFAHYHVYYPTGKTAADLLKNMRLYFYAESTPHLEIAVSAESMDAEAFQETVYAEFHEAENRIEFQKEGSMNRITVSARNYDAADLEAGADALYEKLKTTAAPETFRLVQGAGSVQIAEMGGRWNQYLLREQDTADKLPQIQQFLAEKYPDWTAEGTAEAFTVEPPSALMQTISFEDYSAVLDDIYQTLGYGVRLTINAAAYVIDGTAESPFPQPVIRDYLADAQNAYQTGDVSGDGTVGAADAQLALIAYTEEFAGNGSGLTAAQLRAADLDGNGKVSAEEAQLILIYYTENTLSGNQVSFADLLAKQTK